ncbi:28S rRNA (cytosine-C(5))-methyltransferase [Anthophora plagiata]
MSSGFVHSVKVPRLYKVVAKIVREVRENGGSLKSLLYERKHPNVSAIYSLCSNILQREAQLDNLISKTNLMVNEPRLDVWLAKTLITELLWGKKVLQTDCKPVKTILSYEKQLREELINVANDETLGPFIKTVKKARYARINTLILQLKDGLSRFQEEGWSLLLRCSSYKQHLNAVKSLEYPNFIQDFHIPELLVFPADTYFYDYPGYQNGEIILQDKASCLPSLLLNPKPGSVVLDMCAAPGMKLSHLAAIMKNKGKVHAVDIDKNRYSTLCKQVEGLGASCVETINKDALTLTANEFPKLEYILVDPSCSGSGMLDRKLISNEEKSSPERLKQLQSLQVFLLRHALLNFPKVKRVVYSTCSIHPEENEQVVDEVLENVGNAYRLVPVKKLLKEEWLNFSSKKYNCSDNCLYAISDVDLCNGFFVAVFERNFNVPLPKYNKIRNSTVNEKKMRQETKENQKSDMKKNDQPKRKERIIRKNATDNEDVSPKRGKRKANNKTAQNNGDMPAMKKRKKK